MLFRSISDGYQIIDEMKHPLLCVAWIIDWLTAGEKSNILYSWLAYTSQVVLRNPISVIGIGEGGAGKTHIQDVALSLIPEQFIVTIKSMTDAALYGYCDTNPYYFDGKIVNIGDMGGKNDHIEAQNFKNAMKEMQSEGYMARNKQVPKPDGGYENRIYELFGYPCLSYTNVPGFEFEDQEKSRSIFYQPRVDNDEAVMIFKTLSRMKGTPTTKLLEEKRAKVNDIKKMVLALRNRMDKVNIYNPYNQFIRDFLGSSKYFKRDVDKYDGILRVITAVNGYRRPLVNDTLLTTKEDISIFIDILGRYHKSITSNLTPGAVEVLQDLYDHADEWDLYESLKEDGSPNGITIGDYQHRATTKFGKSTLGNYFRELNAEGLVKTTGKEGQSNLYILVGTNVSVDKDEIELSESDKKMLEFNFGVEAYDVLSSYTSPVNIFMEQPSEPYWNDMLPENKS